MTARETKSQLLHQPPKNKKYPTGCVLAFLFSIFIGGCATTESEKKHPTQEERESIRKVGVAVDLTEPDFEVMGLASGAAIGLVGGFHPMTWVFGGPFITIPALAYVGAKCQSELSSIENPEQYFQETINRLDLSSRLTEHILGSLQSGATANNVLVEVVPSIGQEPRISYTSNRGFDTLLDLKLHVVMSDTVFVERCRPKVAIKTSATLHRVSDGAILAQNNFMAEPDELLGKTLTFQKLLTDQSELARIVEICFGNTINWYNNWILPWLSKPTP